jgi:ankyrin repeat protein
MPSPQLPLEILLDIAHLLTDDDGKLCFADFNSFLKVNRTLYVCLNRTLWQKAVESKPTTMCVFNHVIHTNDLARLKFFLELGADVETFLYKSRGQATGTPLHVAVQLNNVPMARLLLEHGADPAKYDGTFNATIHLARSGEMVQLLLDHNADPEQLERCCGFRPLHCYAMRGDIEAMRVILRSGAEVDPRDTNGNTPLHWAVRDNIDGVELLLEHGADVKNRCTFLQTPLHLAVTAGKADVVRLLLEHWHEGARAKDRFGRTPLHRAATQVWYRHGDMVRMLVESWPDGRKTVNNHGMTPLSLFEEFSRGWLDINQRKELIALLSVV